jgi:hypothetical protein
MHLIKKLPLPLAKGLKVSFLKIINKLKTTVETLNSVLNKETEILEALQADLESLETFKSAFEEYKKLTPNYQQYKDLAYYHFMLRHILSYYEARTDEMPVQIYNEYRMSFDHYMRRMQATDDGHEKKALDHLLRANLDIVKLSCNWLRKNCEKKHRWVPKKALGIISNGEYIKHYTKLQVRATRSLCEAKEKESLLGEGNGADILDKFLISFLKHKEWSEYQESNFENVIYIRLRYYLIIGLPLAISVAIGFFLGKLFEEFYQQLLPFLKFLKNLASFN